MDANEGILFMSGNQKVSKYLISSYLNGTVVG